MAAFRPKNDYHIIWHFRADDFSESEFYCYRPVAATRLGYGINLIKRSFIQCAWGSPP